MSANHVIQQRGYLSWTIGMLAKTVVILLAALMCSILLEWVGMTFFWPDAGAARSRAMVAAELDFLGLYANTNPLFNGFDQTTISLLLSIQRWLVDHGLGVLAGQFELLAQYIDAALNVVSVFVLRLAVMILAMPVYLFFGLVGATRGLVNRELRKWGGGRESSGLFHLFMRMIPLGFLGSWFLYLSWPFTINPNVIVLPFALFFGATIMAMTYRYKKYV